MPTDAAPEEGHQPSREILVGLSTSSLFPSPCEEAFSLAKRLGYDGIEIMVWTERATQDPRILRTYMERYDLPVLSVHAPTLLLTQYLWGSDPWVKIDRSIEIAQAVGAPVVIVHPPFRWQREYAYGFVAGVREREERTGIRIAVENMFPWRSGMEIPAYLPDWDPTDESYANICLDLSHAATAGDDVLAMLERTGDRLAHIHLADGLGSFKDEHLVPGRGNQPCAELLDRVRASSADCAVVVEVNTRRGGRTVREADLAEALQFARRHLGRPVADGAARLLDDLAGHAEHTRKAGKKAHKHARRKDKRARKSEKVTPEQHAAKAERRKIKKAKRKQAQHRKASKREAKQG